MKIVEISGGFPVQITNEETALLRWFDEQDKVPKQDLTEHEQLVANQLVQKDLLTRRNEDGQITYKRRTR